MVNIRTTKKREPRVGLAVILIKDERVLLGKRKNAHGEGTWSFPGGHLEMYEGFKRCGEREVEEETGLVAGRNFTLAGGKPVTFTNDFFRKEKKHYVTFYMIADYHFGEPAIKEPEKCEEWGWFYWGNLPKPLFTPVSNLIKQGYNPFNS